MTLFQDSIKLFRIAGFIEGTGLVLLVFIAMPLKYMADLPSAVTVMGSLHGFFFVLYLFATAYATLQTRWSIKWTAAAIAVAFIPFGNYVLDIRLQKANIA